MTDYTYMHSIIYFLGGNGENSTYVGDDDDEMWYTTPSCWCDSQTRNNSSVLLLLSHFWIC